MCNCTWHHSLGAGHTFRGKLIAVTLVTHQGVFLTGERLVGQRTAAARAAETVFMIMPLLIIQLLNTDSTGTHTDIDLLQL